MNPLALAAAAAELARSGLPVFPCAADKKPCTAHGFKDALRDPLVARSLFWNTPAAAAIGVPTGPVSGLAVIDIDPQGMDWFTRKVSRLPQTRIHRTPRGGFHLLYRCPDPPIKNSTGRLGPGVDTRGDGGYIIHPPSPGYTVIDDSDPVEFPRWVAKILAKPPTERQEWDARKGGDLMALARFVANAPHGERNVRLFWASCRVGENGGNPQELIDAARAVGLDDIEIRATINSGLQRGGQVRGTR